MPADVSSPTDGQTVVLECGCIASPPPDAGWRPGAVVPCAFHGFRRVERFASETTGGNADHAPPSKPRTFEEAVDAILAEMRATMIRKQRDYGSSNIAAFGEVGVLVRAHDKLARLRHLLWERRGKAPENEPVEDSWLDLANYGLIGLMCWRGWWGLPMREELESLGI